MSFLARNEYLLGEIDYCHDQLCARLTDDAWSTNYGKIWDNICLQLRWYDYLVDQRAADKLVRRLLGHTRYGRLWPFDSPVLNGTITLARSSPIACRTIFGFDLLTTGQGPWETIAYGVFEPGETLLLMRLLPYVDYLLEIGAGNGYYSFLAAQNGVSVTAIEPSPAEYKLLRSGISLNGFAGLSAPLCSVGETATGRVIYLENGSMVKTLALADYRAAGTLIKLTGSGFEQLLTGAVDWLATYDAPSFMITAPAVHGQARTLPPEVLKLFADCDYQVYAVIHQPSHGFELLVPPAQAPKEPVDAFLALPPMAQDLAESLTKSVDMRVFTDTAKLENLYHFVKTTFDEL
jgi:hypothetical protein